MPRAGIAPAYIDWLFTCERALMGHLYQFNAIGGAVDYFTDLDFTATWNGINWKASGLRIDGLRRKIACGLEVDEQQLNIIALPTDTIFGSTFLSAAETGILDGCQITRYRAIWPSVSGNLFQDMVNIPPFQVWTMFTGYASKIEAGGMTHFEMKVKSPLVKLEVNMPRNYYQPGCLWNLFDVGYTPPAGYGCQLNQATYAVNGVALSNASPLILPVSGGIATPIGADGISNYAQGRILFTSGANDGLLTLIDDNDASNLYLAYPLATPPSAGDTFTFYPGCSKSFNTCTLKFANGNNFRGFDKVPPVSVSI